MERTAITRQAYEQTGKDLIQKLARLCVDQGEHLNDRYGPKYRLTKGDLSIYVDNYGGYALVQYKGETVLCSHFCDQAMVQGQWEIQAEQMLGIQRSFAGENI